MLVDVEHGAGDGACAQRIDQRRLVDDRAATDVDQEGGVLHRSQARRVR